MTEFKAYGAEETIPSNQHLEAGGASIEDRLRTLEQKVSNLTEAMREMARMLRAMREGQR